MIDSEDKLNVWDHVEDLRHTLIRIAGVVFVGFVLTLCFHQPLFEFLTNHWQNSSFTPLTEQTIQQIRITNRSPLNQSFSLPAGAQVTHQHHSQADPSSPSIYRLESQGYLDYEQESSPKLLFLSPLEGLLLTFKVSFWLSIALTAPLWGWILLQFVLPGLHVHEKAIAMPFILGSFFCTALGLALAHFLTIPLANQYLLAFNASLGQNAWSFGHYIDYTLLIYFGHVVALEICLLLLLMVHFGILSADWLISKRRYMIVAAFILAAFLTPPDVLTQLALAIPLVGLYELAILYGKWRNLHNLNA